MPDDWAQQEMARQAREIERLHEQVRNPTPPMVPLSLFEEVRKTQGERIGLLENQLRSAQSKIWTALLFPILVGVAVAVILTSIQ